MSGHEAVLTDEWRRVRAISSELADANIVAAPRVANPMGRRTRRAGILTLVGGRSAYVRDEPGRGTVAVISTLAACERAARRDGERDALGLDPGDGDEDPLPQRANRPASIPAGGRR